MQTHEVLLGPVVSEKATELAADNKYTFRVSGRSNKVEIRRAVESRYGVKVSSVRTVSMPAKEKGAGYIGRSKSRRGYNVAWKKAIVTLQVGDRIADFFGAV
jgi:large subunit ribosomal protein L23